MGGIKGFVGAGLAFALGLSLSACGGSGAHPKSAAVPLSADALQLGLLPASDFDAGARWNTKSPSDFTDDVAVTKDSGCQWLSYGGSPGTEIASAHVYGHQQTEVKWIYERADQYRPGGAATALATMVDQGHGKCASYSSIEPHTATDDPYFALRDYDTTVVTPESGLGDKADLFEVKSESPSGSISVVYDTLTVEYGDVLISVGCIGTPEFRHSCDVDAKVKKIAGLLKLT